MLLDFEVLRKKGHKRLADQIFLFVQSRAMLQGVSIEETLLIKSAQTSYPFDKAWVVEKLQV
jgi:hypothetical protein